MTFIGHGVGGGGGYLGVLFFSGSDSDFQVPILILQLIFFTDFSAVGREWCIAHVIINQLSNLNKYEEK